MSLKFPHIPTSKTLKGAVKKNEWNIGWEGRILTTKLVLQFPPRLSCNSRVRGEFRYGMWVLLPSDSACTVFLQESINQRVNQFHLSKSTINLTHNYKAVKAGSERGKGWVSFIPAPFPRKSRVLNFLQKLIKVNVRCRLAVSIVIVNLHVF